MNFAASNAFTAAGILFSEGKVVNQSVGKMLKRICNNITVTDADLFIEGIDGRQLESLIKNNIVHKVRRDNGTTCYEFENVTAKTFFQQNCK